MNRGERYMLEMPSKTAVRKVAGKAARPPRLLSPHDIEMRCRYQADATNRRASTWVARGLQPPPWSASRDFT
jgi:hypothetical protein